MHTFIFYLPSGKMSHWGHDEPFGKMSHSGKVSHSAG
jgi:hypothetical protein